MKTLLDVDGGAAMAATLVVLAVPPGPAGDSRRASGSRRLRSRAVPWINSEPLTMEKLRGRVVAVEFWTFG